MSRERELGSILSRGDIQSASIQGTFRAQLACGIGSFLADESPRNEATDFIVRASYPIVPIKTECHRHELPANADRSQHLSW